MGNFDVYTFKRVDQGRQEQRRPKLGGKRKARPSFFVRLGAIVGGDHPRLRAAFSRLWDIVSQNLQLSAVPHLLVEFVLARTVLLGELMPLGTAYLAAALVYRPTLGWGMLLALAAGAGSSTLPGEVVPLLVMGLVVMGILASARTSPERWWVTLPFLVLSVYLLVRNCILIYEGWNLYREFAIIFEAVIAAVLSFIFLVALGRFQQQRQETRLEEAVAGAVLGICIVLGISDLSIGGWSISAVIGGLVVLLAARLGGAGAGAAGGALLGLLPSVTQMITPYAVGIYALAGMLGGLFRRWGRIGTVLGFSLGYLLLTLYISEEAPGRELLFNAAGSAVLFLVLPPRLFDYLGEQVASGGAAAETEPPPAPPSDGEDCPVWWKTTTQRLYHLTSLMGEVAAALEERDEASADEEADQFPELMESIRQGLCPGCSRHSVCWQEEFYTTYRVMLDLLGLIEARGRLEEAEAAATLKNRCLRSRELLTLFSHAAEVQQKKNYWKGRYQEGRKIVSHQVEGVAQVLRDTLKELEGRTSRRRHTEREIADELRRLKVKADDIRVYQLPNLDWEVFLRRRGCQLPGDCRNRLLPALSRRLGCRLELRPEKCSWPPSASCQLSLTPAKELAVEVGIAQAAKPGAVCSGDSILTGELTGGRYLLALSDGMGAGSDASRISRQTLALLKHLLETGVELKHAVQSLNTLLKLRSAREDFATLDLALISLRDGQASLVKLGAPPSLLRRGQEVRLVNGGAPPVGILDRLEPNEVKLKLESGDCLIMVSDGVLDSHFHAAEREAWLLGLVKRAGDRQPQELADYLLLQAVGKKGRRPDDMAVVVAKLVAADAEQR